MFSAHGGLRSYIKLYGLCSLLQRYNITFLSPRTGRMLNEQSESALKNFFKFKNKYFYEFSNTIGYLFILHYCT